jgi:hypothetical protein
MSVIGRRMRTKAAAIALSVLLFILGVTIVAVAPPVVVRETFKRHVIRPIPPSVHNIRMDRCQMASLWRRLHGRHEHAFVLRFDVRRKDLLQIVRAKGLKLQETIEYREGNHWYATQGYAFTFRDLYREKTRDPPRWFDLDEWAGAEIYAAGQDTLMNARMDISYLFFNEQLGSAYVIRLVRTD